MADQVGDGEAEGRDGTLDHAATAAERGREPVPDELLDGGGVDRSAAARWQRLGRGTGTRAGAVSLTRPRPAGARSAG